MFMNRNQYQVQYYQDNQEKLRRKRRERWLIQQEEKKREKKQLMSKYSRASAYRVLMSLKDYTELNQSKHKKWWNFMETFNQLVRIGFRDIADIMRLRELAEKVLADFWETAKQEKSKKVKRWNGLSGEEQQRIIKHWALEKEREEKQLLDELEELERQGSYYEKEIEMAKFHEERGKMNCECWQCELANRGAKENEEEDERKVECPDCGKKVWKLDEENGICKECMRKYES